MNSLINNIKRLFWLFRSAKLAPTEFFVVLVNKSVYATSRFYFFLVNLLTGRPQGAIYGYRRHIPKGMKPIGRCLLAYLPEVVHKEYFIGSVKYYFSNNGAPLSIMQALNEMGYELDLIGFGSTDFKPTRHYDLFFYHQYEIYEALHPRLNKDVVSVQFETTAYYKKMVERINARLDYFKQRHNVELSPKKFNHFIWMKEQKDLVERVSKAADGVIIMGDQQALTFEDLENPHKFLIQSAVYPDPVFTKDISSQNLEKGRKKFLFFGGGQDVMRKGLDVLLDAFIGTDYELYFCIDMPEKIGSVYDFQNHSNLHNLGYLKVGSQKFYDTLSDCNFIIQPAAAEGIPGGVLETMKYGLMPIVTKECNLPEASEVGYMLDGYSVAEVKKAITHMASLPVETLEEKAKAAKKVIATVYTPRNFMDDIKKAVKEVTQHS